MFNVNMLAGTVLSRLLTHNNSIQNRHKLLLTGSNKTTCVLNGNRIQSIRWNNSTVAVGNNCCYTYMFY